MSPEEHNGILFVVMLLLYVVGVLGTDWSQF